MAVFDELMSVNVNGHTEKKKTGGNDLTYLSWPFAWAEVKKRYPDAHYEIEKFGGLPYVYDERTGYMVYTTVTIEGISHEMWLPVMDGANKAMKAVPYEYTVRDRYKGEQVKTVAAATMFDINKTVMRCLVKNLAMFGLGLYIYAGEDLPESDANEEPPKCELCGHFLTPYKGLDGKNHGISELVELSRKNFNKVLCYPCVKVEAKKGKDE